MVVSAVVVRFFGLPDWVPASAAIPTATMSMLIAILVSTPVGVFFSLAVSPVASPPHGNERPGIPVRFSQRGGCNSGGPRRGETAGSDSGGSPAVASVGRSFSSFSGCLQMIDPARFSPSLAGACANGFLCSILTLGFLPVFEYLLNAPTRFKLMELSDLNSPIFKRMLSQAPGTYTHSISVANLAETACEAIGANALLARVSAYYHDIGKVDQADYFIENQKAYNRHDEMKPSLSVAVIKSHVRIGIEKARELKLPAGDRRHHCAAPRQGADHVLLQPRRSRRGRTPGFRETITRIPACVPRPGKPRC